MLDLEDICLLIIEDGEETENHWLNHWAYGYPVHLRVTTPQDKQATSNIQAIDNTVKNIVGNFLWSPTATLAPLFCNGCLTKIFKCTAACLA